MNNIGDKNNFLKNPIGVIGIFLVLTEAIASTVIVKSNLNDMQNTILVIFVVAFPCLVLVVFYILVTRHHEKLYSPSDYKDEKNFVNTYNNATQKSEVRRIECDYGTFEEKTSKDIVSIKKSLADIIKFQKKILPNVEKDVLSDEDKENLTESMDEYLTEIEDIMTLKVDVTPMYKSDKFVEELIRQGYSASLYRFEREEKKVIRNAENEAIWLGSEVPIKMVVDVLKTAKKYYPHLKYIYLHDGSDEAPVYVKYQIYIGGSSNTAKEYGLKTLNKEDFEQLFRVQTRDELHNFVKKFDPRFN